MYSKINCRRCPSECFFLRYHRYRRYEIGRCGPNSFLYHSGSFSMNVEWSCIFALNHKHKSFHSLVIYTLIDIFLCIQGYCTKPIIYIDMLCHFGWKWEKSSHFWLKMRKKFSYLIKMGTFFTFLVENEKKVLIFS